MQHSSIISFENAGIFYGNLCAARGVNFNVNEGETFGLLGVNGAGKSSLIRAITGLRRLSEGRARVFGLDPQDKKSRARLSYLPERFSPPWFLTGLEFIKFTLGMYNQTYNEKEIINQAERLALEENALRRRTQTYSKGMRQKIGFLATVLADCPLMIMDEPTNSLDPLARNLVKGILKEEKGKGRTLFLSSHIMADMEEICDRVALLDHSEIRFAGSPGALKTQTGTATLEQAFLHSIVQKEAA